eukprot:3143238-Rhodomonas_salina.1
MTWAVLLPGAVRQGIEAWEQQHPESGNTLRSPYAMPGTPGTDVEIATHSLRGFLYWRKEAASVRSPIVDVRDGWY